MVTVGFLAKRDGRYQDYEGNPNISRGGLSKRVRLPAMEEPRTSGAQVRKRFSEKMRSTFKDSVKSVSDAQHHAHEDEVEVSSTYDEVGK